jgi:hypothetical protein
MYQINLTRGQLERYIRVHMYPTNIPLWKKGHYTDISGLEMTPDTLHVFLWDDASHYSIRKPNVKAKMLMQYHRHIEYYGVKRMIEQIIKDHGTTTDRVYVALSESVRIEVEDFTETVSE